MPRTKLAEKHAKKTDDTVDQSVKSAEVTTEKVKEEVEPVVSTPSRASKKVEKEVVTEEKSEVEKLVDQVIFKIGGFNAKFNGNLSVVDLADRKEPNGTRFRQLLVRVNPGHMGVTIVEGFNSLHGGTPQTKTIAHFRVPVGEVKAYDKLYRRFFGYKTSQNLTNGNFLVDTLTQTVTL